MSFTVFKFKGVPVIIHWLFTLVFALAVIFSLRTSGIGDALDVSIRFTCITLSLVTGVFAMAVVAARYGDMSLKLTVYPYFVAAELPTYQERPASEFLTAVAGPLAALLLAGASFLGYYLTAGIQVQLLDTPLSGYFRLVTDINFLIATVNLLPVVPLSGGRMVRSLLVAKMSFSTATSVSLVVSLVTAALMIVYGWFNSVTAFIFGIIFIFVARSDYTWRRIEYYLKGAPVSEVMASKLVTVPWNVLALPLLQEIREMDGDPDHVYLIQDERGEVTRFMSASDILQAPYVYGTNLISNLETRKTGSTTSPAADAVETLKNAVKKRQRGVLVVDPANPGNYMGIITLQGVKNRVKELASRDSKVKLPWRNRSITGNGTKDGF